MRTRCHSSLRDVTDVADTHSMDDQSASGCAGEGHALGSHRLGPHVVGQRVVVRYLLDDGRANDVLGICLAWTDTETVIDQDPRGDAPGGPVRIRVAAIVTGKPVPRRASVRNRLSPRDVEGHTTALWADVEVVGLGEWQLRAVDTPGRRRRRGNSLLAMGDPGIPVAEATERARAFYGERGLPTLAQCVLGSDEETALLALGWQRLGSGDAECQLASVARALRACSREADGPSGTLPVDLVEEGSRIDVVLGDGVARGSAALDGDWVGLHDLQVEQAHRGQGLATAVITELLDWGASHGAMTAFVHVESDNTASLALHERLGFVTHHAYGYLTR